ncbi:hypothetical protein RUM44_002401 [Polyplax serrata]|uniref:Uncharacterized protein n=1 Tax=Polyplax serrata TaxID=468196 RepID=A0ABR1AEN8_POLSC
MRFGLTRRSPRLPPPLRFANSILPATCRTRVTGVFDESTRGVPRETLVHDASTSEEKDQGKLPDDSEWKLKDWYLRETVLFAVLLCVCSSSVATPKKPRYSLAGNPVTLCARSYARLPPLLPLLVINAVSKGENATRRCSIRRVGKETKTKERENEQVEGESLDGRDDDGDVLEPKRQNARGGGGGQPWTLLTSQTTTNSKLETGKDGEQEMGAG